MGVDFLNDGKTEVRAIATEHVVPYCGTEEGRSILLRRRKEVVEKLVRLLGDVLPIAHNAYRALINLSAGAEGGGGVSNTSGPGASWARAMVEAGIVPVLFRVLLDPDAVTAELAAMALANCTRSEDCVFDLFDTWNENSEIEIGLVRLVRAFRLKHFHNPGASMDFLAPVFSNITQTPDGRALFLKKDATLLVQLLPFLEDESVVRRGGVLGTIRNLVYETDKHDILLDPAGTVDLIPKLFKLLMDGSVLPPEDVIGMPLDVRNMPYTHTREDDPELRKMVVDTLFYLALVPESRATLIDSKVYIIVRNAHLEEKDDDVSRAMFRLIDVVLPEIFKDDPNFQGPPRPAPIQELPDDDAGAAASSSSANPDPFPDHFKNSDATYDIGDGNDDPDIIHSIKPLADDEEEDALVDLRELGLADAKDSDEEDDAANDDAGASASKPLVSGTAAAASAAAEAAASTSASLSSFVANDGDDVE